MLLTLLGAGMLLAHLAALLAALRSRQPRWMRAAAILPPLAPIVAWRGGARLGPLLWLLLLLAYLGARFFLG
ncbi:MAG: hypothetical protein OEY14_10880 [Myxococcales bacterium]|nr:hypothetical protein [Myxococcales bacterium]